MHCMNFYSASFKKKIFLVLPCTLKKKRKLSKESRELGGESHAIGGPDGTALTAGCLAT